MRGSQACLYSCAGLSDPLAKVQLASANMLAQALSAPDPTAFRTRGSLQVGECVHAVTLTPCI